MKKILVLIMSCGLLQLSLAQSGDTLTFDPTTIQQYYDSVESTFTYQEGSIDIKEGLATITVPKGYRFLGAEESGIVLSDMWGNPPSEVLGMLFPAGMSPMSDSFSYAVEITYSEDGFIEDEDAEDIDYDELLQSMQEDAEAVNETRIELGYEPVELVGWASAPFYDKANKKLHWAKELKFGQDEVNTLNYNIRILGRRGYLNMNAIGEMDVLPAFQQDIDEILASVEFQEGNRYADFNPNIDQVAAYGIGGLIAGKMLAKAGFFGLLAKFWKIIAIGAVAAFAGIKRFIFGGSSEEDEAEA